MFQTQETKVLVKELVFLCLIIMVISGSQFAHFRNGFERERLRLWGAYTRVCLRVCVRVRVLEIKRDLNIIHASPISKNVLKM